MEKKDEKKQVISVWCPNCGIPRTAKMRLKQFLSKGRKTFFYCSSCGLKVEIGLPSKKQKDDSDITMKDITKATKLVKMVGKGLM